MFRLKSHRRRRRRRRKKERIRSQEPKPEEKEQFCKECGKRLQESSDSSSPSCGGLDKDETALSWGRMAGLKGDNREVAKALNKIKKPDSSKYVQIPENE